MKVFKSIGHFFAVAIQAILVDGPKIEAGAPVVEAVTSLVPVYGPLAVTVEKAGYALLGELLGVLHAGGEAAEAKLADAGLDANVIATIKAVGSDPSIKSVAKML